MEKTVGIIGLGNMGKPMAENLLKTFSVVVYDLNSAAAGSLQRLGAELAKSPRAMAAAADAILLSLPSAKEVEAVMLGNEGVLSHPEVAGRVIIDLSTSRPALTRKIYAEAKKLGAHFLDAPVTGGKKGAVEGSLTLMVGGDEEIFSAHSDIFHAIGKNVFYAGPSGMGHTAKIIHNLVSASNIAILAEAFVMARKTGVDPKVMIDIINNGAARSYMSETKDTPTFCRTDSKGRQPSIFRSRIWGWPWNWPVLPECRFPSAPWYPRSTRWPGLWVSETKTARVWSKPTTSWPEGSKAFRIEDAIDL